MSNRRAKKKFVLVIGALSLLISTVCLPALVMGADTGANPPENHSAEKWQSYTPEELKAALATLSDEQVRTVLLAELEKAAQAEAANNRKVTHRGAAKILHHFETLIKDGPQRVESLAAGFARLPAELAEVFQDMTAATGGGLLLLQLAGMIAIIGGAHGVEVLVGRSLFKLSEKLSAVPLMSGLTKISGALLTLFPPLFGLFIFLVVSVVAFLTFFGSGAGVRPLFGICLAVIVVGRLFALVSRFFCAPENKSLRLIPLDDAEVQSLHRRLTRIAWVLAIGYLSHIWLKRMGVPFDSYIHIILAIGTLSILMVAEMIWSGRETVARHLVADTGQEGSASAWLRLQFATVWHVLALGALFITWFAWASRLALYGPQFGHGFIRSLLVVPLYLLFDRLVGWLLPAILGPAHETDEDPVVPLAEHPAHTEPTAEDAAKGGGESAPGPEELPVDEGERPIQVVRTKLPVIRGITRVVIFLGLLVWLLRGWNFEVPYIAKVANAAFDIVTTLFLALFIWRGLNRLISRKLKETEPEPAEDSSKGDDEWGGSGIGSQPYVVAHAAQSDWNGHDDYGRHDRIIGIGGEYRPLAGGCRGGRSGGRVWRPEACIRCPFRVLLPHGRCLSSGRIHKGGQCVGVGGGHYLAQCDVAAPPGNAADRSF